jgi:aryl-alcohol dehydrogenase-like predicted oxidoreductase
MAFDLGINHFDTADVYAGGEAEKALGKVVRSLPRKDIVIASKVYFPAGDGPNDQGLSRKHTMESCAASLKRIGTEYLDLYYCHRYDDGTPLEEVARAMDDLVHQGKVLYWAVSMWKADQIDAAVRFSQTHNLYKPQANQPVYNLFDRGIEEDVLETCARHGIGLCVYSPLAYGVLTGKYQQGQVPKGSRAADKFGRHFLDRYLKSECLDAVDELLLVAEECGLTPAQLSIAWCLRHPEVSCAIIGASRPKQIKENVKASGIILSPEVLKRIDSAFSGPGLL